MNNKKAAFFAGSVSRKMILGSGIFCLMSLLLLSGCQKEEKVDTTERQANVQIVTVAKTEAMQVRELSGRVEQTGIAALAPEVSGRLIKIAVLDGQNFKKGQVIAEIDPEPYQLAAQRASAQYQQLADDLNRKRQLRDEKILSQGGFQQLEAATEVARVQMALAKRDLRNTRLVAPFSGRLASRNVELWQTVQAGTPAFNLENTERLDVSVNLPQVIAQRLPLTNALRATAWLPERPDLRFPLTFRERTTQSTPGGGVFRLIFSGARPEGVELLAGMSLRVSIEADVGEVANETLVVPMSSLIVNKNGSHHVWKVNPQTNAISAVQVTVKEIQQDKVLVEGGIRAGDQIVGAGSQFLRDGQRVYAIGRNS